jgi:DNA-binding transcriptional LysR family regulator
MEFHQLRYFCAIATYGTFTRAAKSEHVAQPSLSQQILKLEDELGGKLFYRLPRAARLTPLGEFFLPHALAILQEIRTSKAGARKIITAGWPQLDQNTTLIVVNEPPADVEPSPSTDSKTGLRAFRKGA